jgi:hypothetical protein
VPFNLSSLERKDAVHPLCRFLLDLDAALTKPPLYFADNPKAKAILFPDHDHLLSPCYSLNIHEQKIMSTSPYGYC